MSHLIIGCGYLGMRVAKQWLAEGKRVSARTRSRSEELRAVGIEPIIGDVLDPQLELPAVDTVLFAVASDRAAGKSFRETYLWGLQNVLARLPRPRRFILVSSTSVYGQNDGEWVDESSPTEPKEVNGLAVLEAEQLLRSTLPDALILRFAGIYGPGRILRRQSLSRGDPLQIDPEKWLNLIHVDDGAEAIVHAAERAESGGTLIVSDDEPVRRRDFYGLVTQLLGAPPPRFEPLPLGVPPPPHEGGNRKASNRKLRQHLKVEIRYPNYRVGLRDALGKTPE